MSAEGEVKIPLTHWDVSGKTASGTWAVKRRLATAMRDVIERLVRTDAPEAELDAAAEALERYADRLATHPRRVRMDGFAEMANAGGVEAAFFDYSPLIGRCNPLAPPVEIRAEGDKAVGEVTFGSAYEGPPGCVHGGWVAAAFDEVLGFAQSLNGTPGMTGTLTIRYRKPTPLLTPLRFEARLTKREGRKCFVTGELYGEGILTAEAEGIFVTVNIAKFQQLMELRNNREKAR